MHKIKLKAQYSKLQDRLPNVFNKSSHSTNHSQNAPQIISRLFTSFLNMFSTNDVCIYSPSNSIHNMK